MKAKSNTSKSSGKPDKPYDGFPMFAHGSGQWAKKIRGRVHYFGSWRVDPEGTEALEQFNHEWPYLKDGRTPPPMATGDECTLLKLCNAFLTSKKNKLDCGELSRHTFDGYHRTCERMLGHLAKDRRVDDFRPDDFERFRKLLAKSMGVVALKNEVNRVRIVFKYAFDQRLIDHPVVYGQSFDKPRAKMIRKARNEAGPMLLEAGELRRLINSADPILKTMVLLGVNGGLGNTDVANLPKSAIDFKGGWLDYPRPKTEIPRRVPLWPETVEALRTALKQRPGPKDPADAGLVFLTIQGNRYVQIKESETTEGKSVRRDTVAARFGALLKKLEIHGPRRMGFYVLRHVFETTGGECRDQPAVDAIMGHVAPSMAATYREKISDERLRAVVNLVHSWLFDAADTDEDEHSGGGPALRVVG